MCARSRKNHPPYASIVPPCRSQPTDPIEIRSGIAGVHRSGPVFHWKPGVFSLGALSSPLHRKSGVFSADHADDPRRLSTIALSTGNPVCRFRACVVYTSRSIPCRVSDPVTRSTIQRSATASRTHTWIRGELHPFSTLFAPSVEVYLEFVSTRPTFGFGPAELAPAVRCCRVDRRSSRNTGANYRLTFGTADLHRGSIHARHMWPSDSHWVSYPNRTFRIVAFEFEIGLNRAMRFVSHSFETAASISRDLHSTDSVSRSSRRYFAVSFAPPSASVDFEQLLSKI